MTGKIQPKDGFRQGNPRSFANRVGKHRSLVFNVIKGDVPEPYEILWKIKNTGEEAASLGQLRGSIFQGGHTHHESTLYTGPSDLVLELRVGSSRGLPCSSPESARLKATLMMSPQTNLRVPALRSEPRARPLRWTHARDSRGSRKPGGSHDLGGGRQAGLSVCFWGPA